MVQLQYTLTLDEVNESQRTILANGKPVRWIVSLLFWIYILGAMLGFTYFNADRTHVPYTENFWLTLAPPLVSMLAVSLHWGLAVQTQRRNLKPKVLHAAAYSRWVSSLIPVMLLSPTVFLAIAMIPAFAIQWHPSPAWRLVVGLVPWVVCFILLQAIVAALAPSRGRRAMKMWPWLSRPHVVEVSEAGIHIRDGVVDAQLGWAYFIRFRETKNLILMHTEQNQPFILPKRAIASEEDESALRSLIQSNIAHGKFIAREARFAVLPIQKER
jgi:hypothetical protein